MTIQGTRYIYPIFRTNVGKLKNYYLFGLPVSTTMADAQVGVLIFLLLSSSLVGLGQSYTRPPPRKTLTIPFEDGDSTSPQQVHISLVGFDKMRISWITEGDSTAVVRYGTSSGANSFSATGETNSYRYALYESGRIHDVVVGPLKPATVYYYRCGPDSIKEFTFTTPPNQFPINFAVSGDMGQTGWTNSTLQHINASDYDVLIFPGDLSYADYWQPLWDSFGRLVEPLASQRPWMVTEGNHEIEAIPLVAKSFRAYNARWRMPFEESGSTSNLYYSFDVHGIHILMLGSYTDFDVGSDQYKWLQTDLARVDRKKTPWLFAVIHAPWYNSNTAHQGEGDDMKEAMEELLYSARTDVVFAGHVHAYERFVRVYNGKQDDCGAIHITIGDGGNKEGLAGEFVNPKPEISAFREASFGHGRVQVANETHAVWSWHRNDDDAAVEADKLWFTSLASNKACSLST